MIKRTNVHIITIIFLALACFFLLVPTTHAQQSLSLSVTPPLFQMNVHPGETFQSAIKIINNNPYPITVWAEAVEFAASGEDGHGRFIPVMEGGLDEGVMASWIGIVDGPYTIDAEQSFNVPFSITVPENAPPGGHSAAILVGTRPPQGSGAAVVNTSQMVTSLFFARVAGDIVEKGDIREFSVSQLLQSSPQATFTLRFENEGNVHIKPTGNITIYNMWGKERGYIPINQKTAYGNVLPEGVRKYEFSWVGEQSITDIGRYKAIATVGYGQTSTVYLDRTTYFWVVPIKATLITLVVVLSIAFLIVWMIRQYVRRAMLMAGFDPDAARKERKNAQKVVAKNSEVKVARVVKKASMTAPLRAGVIDLRARMSDATHYKNKCLALLSFITQYKVFTLSILGLVLVVIVVWWYLIDVRTENRNYEVTLPQDGKDVQISSEEIIKDRMEEAEATSAESAYGAGTQADSSIEQTEQSFLFEIINASGKPGAAASVALNLESLGYRIDSISTDADREQNRSVIVYDASLEDAAVLLSSQLGNVPLSVDIPDSPGTATGEVTDDPTLLLVVGKDLIVED